MRRESGFALILVIWALVALASLASGFVLGSRHEIHLARDAMQELKVDAAVIEALNYSFLALNRRHPEDRWQADGTVHELPERNGVSMRVRVRSEAGKVDINRAPPEVLESLISDRLPGKTAQALCDALIDWRDPDDQALPQGAEADDYIAAGYKYTPANRPFQSVQELSRVMGFDSDSVAMLLPYITVYSGTPLIDPLSASLVTLKAIPGIDAQSFVEARREQGAALSESAIDLLQAGDQYIDTSSNFDVIGVDIEVRLKDSATQVQQIIAQLGPDHYYHVIAHGTPESTVELIY